MVTEEKDGMLIIMWKRIERFYPPWLELIAPLLLGFVLAYTAYNYASLPDIMPTHFNLSGKADDWSHKGFISVYLALLIGFLVWLSMILMNYFLIIKPDDPGKYVNLTKKQKEKLGPTQLEYIRTITARGMIAINITVAGLITVIQYEAINLALGLQTNLSWGVHIFSIAIVVESIWLSVKTVSATNMTKSKGK